MFTIGAMTKTQAVEIFGSVPRLATAVGVTRHAVYQWPEQLSQATTDRVVGAAIRAGIDIPSELKTWDARSA